MAKPSFTFYNMENDEDMKKGLAAIEAESENAHRRYQQLLGFKKPLLKLVSSIGETEMDSQQKDSVQQMMVSLPGSPSLKINRKIALLGVLYGEKCKEVFDSVSRSVQTLQGLRRVLMNYLEKKHSDNAVVSSRFVAVRSPNHCYGCATTFVTVTAVAEVNNLIKKKVMYCLEHHRSMDIAASIREEMQLLSETCSIADEFWEARLRIAFQLLFSSIKVGARHPAIAEHIILPCLRIISQACTPPKSELANKEAGNGKGGLNSETKSDESAKNSFSPSNNNVNGGIFGLCEEEIQSLTIYQSFSSKIS
jgi:E3 ubiquitin-protein ligase UBR4